MKVASILIAGLVLQASCAADHVDDETSLLQTLQVARMAPDHDVKDPQDKSNAKFSAFQDLAERKDKLHSADTAAEKNAEESKSSEAVSDLTNATTRWQIEPLELAMARLASFVYEEMAYTGVDMWPYGWRTIKAFSVVSDSRYEADYFGLFQNFEETMCVVAFAGSNSALDFISNVNIKSRSYCGLDMDFHDGFVNELENLRNDKYGKFGWIEDWLNDTKKNKCPKIYLAGHSLGAAMAETFAHCHLNNPDYYSSKRIPRIDGIFTYGGPAASKHQFHNQGGCIGGKRFYNMDDYYGDSVPGATYTYGFRHPKMEAVRLEEENVASFWKKAKYEYREHKKSCSSSQAKDDPHNWHVPATSYHGIAEYIRRLEKVYGTGCERTYGDPPCPSK